MKLTFHGAAQTVTGSQHLLEVNGLRVLLDCGLYQGKRAIANQRNRNLPFDPTQIDVMVLSHAHIDHAGNIPSLVKKGFQGDILCTNATRDLCVAMLQDSGHIQEKDAEFFNRKIRKKGDAEIEPLYTQADAVAALPSLQGLAYGRPRMIAPDIQLELLDAGHILGSAVVCLTLQDRALGREVRLVFSGDLGQKGLPIIRDPQTVAHADILIMESTYGDRLHPATQESEDALAEVVNRTVRRGGALIVPAFAVGRTQQLVYLLQRLVAAGRIPKLPIFVDSPLATDATEVFRRHPEVYDDEVRAYMSQYEDDDPFGFGNLTYTRKAEDSKALNTRSDSFMVISASGMAEAGRILHHLRNRLGDARNTVLITGWQAPETLGRRLLEGHPKVRIFGEEQVVKAEIIKLNGLSGHGDADDLVEWASALQNPPPYTFLVHGEPAPAKALAQRLKNELHFPHVIAPELGASFEV
jgi:metallo-beta-lactamase family protein